MIRSGPLAGCRHGNQVEARDLGIPGYVSSDPTADSCSGAVMTLLELRNSSFEMEFGKVRLGGCRDCQAMT